VDRLSREQIQRALRELAIELPRRDSPTELVIVGGAALVLLYGARTATKDVDAFTIGSADSRALRSAAARVAASLGLADDWLNDAAKGFVQGFAPGDVLLEAPSLVARTLAPRQLLAMKLSAWRDDVDIEDARLLLSKLDGERERVWASVEPFVVPGRELKARYAFDDLWEAEYGTP
jgi:hypothetical protein